MGHSFVSAPYPRLKPGVKHSAAPAGQILVDVVDRLAENVPHTSPGQAPAGRQRLATLCVLIALCAGVSGLAAADTAASSGPRLLVEPEVLSLGELDTSTGQRIFPALFTLKNDGDAPLRLETPRAGCGCTKVQLAKYELAPGESTELKATLDVTGRYGSQRFSIFVPNNASATPDRLVIEATVPDTRTGWELISPHLSLNDDATTRLHIRHFDKDRELRITALELPNGCEVATSLPLVIAAGGLGRLDIRCRQNLNAPEARLPFAIFSDHTDKPRENGWLLIANKPTPPTPPPGATTTSTAPPAGAAKILPIEVAILKDLIKSMQVVNDLVLLDIRPHEDFKRGHIPRSICYPSTEWQLAQPPWPASAILIVIADRDEMAAKAAELLATSKCRHVLILSGGIGAWTDQLTTDGP
jgi:rhodanese-related sulfurtransferase